MKKDIAIFFDFDGTLVDSRADLASAVNDTRVEFGLEKVSQEFVLKSVGQGAKYLLSNSIPEYTGDFESAWEIFRAHYKERMLDKVELYPTVRETLEALKSKGYLLGINTAKPSFATHAVIDHLDIRQYFGDYVIASGDCDEMKPSAKPIFVCSEKMGHIVNPNDWMVGDHWTDLKCAVNAKINGAFCAFGFGQQRDGVYNARLEKMSDLLNYL